MAQYLAPIDLAKSELRNARVQNLASAPSSPVTGQIYYDTSTSPGVLYYWNGTAWIRADGVGAGASYGSPAASAVGDAAVDGVATTVARSDHKHAREAFAASTATTTFGLSKSDGVALTLARSDHTHGTPAAPTINQLGGQTADYSAGNFKITSLGGPTAGSDAANKTYVDSVRQGMDPKESVKAASTSTQNTAAYSGTTLDGAALISGDRILLKDQSTPSQNGVWVYNGNGSALTRATDADASGELSIGSTVFVEGGTVNGAQVWIVTATAAIPWVPGTDSSTWTQFSGASALTAGAGMTAAGNVFNVIGTTNRITVAADAVDISASYVGQTSITTLGTITTGTWTGTDIAVADGGTGASTAAAARTNLGAVGKYITTVGNGAATSIAVTHSLGTRDVSVAVYQNSSTWDVVYPDIQYTSTSAVTLLFTTAPTTNQYAVVVLG